MFILTWTLGVGGRPLLIGFQKRTHVKLIIPLLLLFGITILYFKHMYQNKLHEYILFEKQNILDAKVPITLPQSTQSQYLPLQKRVQYVPFQTSLGDYMYILLDHLVYTHIPVPTEKFFCMLQCVLEHNNYELLCNLFFALILALGKHFISIYKSGSFVLTIAHYSMPLTDFIQLFPNCYWTFRLFSIFYCKNNVGMITLDCILLCNV